jgi:DNA-binding MarR family transcriptional regulator
MGRIAREIRQDKPYARLEEEAAVTLLRTADVLRSLLDGALKPFGLSGEQYNVLRILRGSPARGLPTLEIASRMVSRAPNITRLVDKLIRKGLVSRCPQAGDRRVVVVKITAKGHRLADQATPAVEAVDAAALARLKPAQLRALIGLLDAARP